MRNRRNDNCHLDGWDFNISKFCLLNSSNIPHPTSLLPLNYRNTCGRFRKLAFLARVLPNFHSCFYNSTKTRKMYSISSNDEILAISGILLFRKNDNFIY